MDGGIALTWPCLLGQTVMQKVQVVVEHINASGAGASCVTANQSGWAAANDSWGVSGWSAGALGSVSYAGTPVQLDIAYGTDEIFNGKGFLV